MNARADTLLVKQGRIFCVANQKGGVGKTTTAINLATSLAAKGKKCLLIDLDPQGNASTGLGIERSARTLTAYDVILGQASIADTVIRTAVDNVDLVPSTVDLSGIEVELASDRARATRLKEALSRFKRPYDYLIVDCPPSLGILTVNALTAANAVLVPLQCEFFALEGLSLLLRTIERVRGTYNSRLQVHGILLTMYDRRNKLSEQVESDVRSFLGSRVYQTIIPRNVRLSEAPSHGVPVLVYDANCAGALAYDNLAGEVLQREQLIVAAA
ncbi:MAG: AAA family ATPase [Pseudomonadota bacterium]